MAFSGSGNVTGEFKYAFAPCLFERWVTGTQHTLLIVFFLSFLCFPGGLLPDSLPMMAAPPQTGPDSKALLRSFSAGPAPSTIRFVRAGLCVCVCLKVCVCVCLFFSLSVLFCPSLSLSLSLFLCLRLCRTFSRSLRKWWAASLVATRIIVATSLILPCLAFSLPSAWSWTGPAGIQRRCFRHCLWQHCAVPHVPTRLPRSP